MSMRRPRWGMTVGMAGCLMVAGLLASAGDADTMLFIGAAIAFAALAFL